MRNAIPIFALFGKLARAPRRLLAARHAPVIGDVLSIQDQGGYFVAKIIDAYDEWVLLRVFNAPTDRRTEQVDPTELDDQERRGETRVHGMPMRQLLESRPVVLAGETVRAAAGGGRARRAA